MRQGQRAQPCQTLRRIPAMQQRRGSKRILDAEVFNPTVKAIVMPAPYHRPRGQGERCPANRGQNGACQASQE